MLADRKPILLVDVVTPCRDTEVRPWVPSIAPPHLSTCPRARRSRPGVTFYRLDEYLRAKLSIESAGDSETQVGGKRAVVSPATSEGTAHFTGIETLYRAHGSICYGLRTTRKFANATSLRALSAMPGGASLLVLPPARPHGDGGPARGQTRAHFDERALRRSDCSIGVMFRQGLNMWPCKLPPAARTMTTHSGRLQTGRGKSRRLYVERPTVAAARSIGQNTSSSRAEAHAETQRPMTRQ